MTTAERYFARLTALETELQSIDRATPTWAMNGAELAAYNAKCDQCVMLEALWQSARNPTQSYAIAVLGPA